MHVNIFNQIPYVQDPNSPARVQDKGQCKIEVERH